MIKAIRKGYYLRIGKGKAQRSVVYARDVAMLLPHLLGRQGIFNLTDGKHPTVAEIDAAIAEKLHRRIWRIPTGLAVILAHIGDFLPRFPFNSRTWKKLTQSLTFSDALARKQLQWNSGPASFDFLKH
jgi:nucleoside-diphosphate-sugar epimerase